MPDEVYDVLFLCTGNSARSILAECLLNRHGAGRFRAYSAGSRPKGEVHTLAIELLQQRGYDTQGLRSKSWDEFARPGSPEFDFIFTVCGNAAQETCPILPGHPTTAHWGVEDPAAVVGSSEQQRQVFRRAYTQLETRIKRLTDLRLEDLDAKGLRSKLERIGQDDPAAGGTE